MNLGLDNKTIIITGGANGIGFAIAKLMYEEGANIVIADLNSDLALSRAAELGDRAIGIRCNVVEEKAVESMVARTKERFGPVHVLVNNAGLTRDMRIEKMQEGDWDVVIDVVLKGAFFCTRAVVPLFREQQWGRIVNI